MLCLYRAGVPGCCHGNFHIPVAAVLHSALLHRVCQGHDAASRTLMPVVQVAGTRLSGLCTLVPFFFFCYKYASQLVLCTDNTVAGSRVTEDLG